MYGILMLEENVIKGGYIIVLCLVYICLKKKVKLFLLIYLKNKIKIGR